MRVFDPVLHWDFLNDVLARFIVDVSLAFAAAEAVSGIANRVAFGR